MARCLENSEVKDGQRQTRHRVVRSHSRQFARRSKAARSALLTPKWWFKSRPRIDPTSGSDPIGRATAVVEAAVDPPIGFSESPQPGTPADVSPAHSPRDSFAAEIAMQPPLCRSAVQFHFDRDLHEVTVRLRYTTAIVSGFAVLVSLGMAYVLGRHIAGGPQSAYAAPTVEELTRRPPQPDVMDVGKRSTPSGVGASFGPADPPRPHNLAQKDEGPATPIGGGTDGHRVVHTNYIIVQSYPTEKSAMEARDFLIKAGIGCTARGEGPWADANWFSVITTTGFQHPLGAEGEAYLRSIERIGEKFAGNSHFKRFEPHWYSWK